MSSHKLIVLSVLGLMAVSGSLAAGASAALVLREEACAGGVTVAFCWAEKAGAELLELSGEETLGLSLAEGEVSLKSVLGGEEVLVGCTGVSNESAGNLQGTILQWTPLGVDYAIDGLTLSFSGCALLGALSAKCSIPATFAFKGVKGEPESALSVLSEEALHLAPETGKIFTEILFEGSSCPETIAGKESVTGSQYCSWGSILEDLATHLLQCASAESHLLLAKSPAGLTVLAAVKPGNLTDIWDIEGSGPAFVLKSEACAGGVTVAFCWAEKAGAELLELSGEETLGLSLAEGEVSLKSVLGGEEVLVGCTGVSNESGGNLQGTILQWTPLGVDYAIDGLTLSFSGCALLGALSAKCTIPATFAFKGVKGEPESAL